MNPEQSHLTKVKILVVDDYPDNIKMLTFLLSKQGYEVQVATNGREAIELVFVAPPDLILLDIKMPEMDGYEVCSYLKADERTRDIPVIFVSSLDAAIDKMQAFAVGGVDYITKPFEPTEVLARLENQLRLRSLQLQLIEQNKLLQNQIESRRQAEVEIRLLLAMNQAINRCDNVHSVLAEVLRLVCISIQWHYGEAWIPNDTGTLLKCSQGSYCSDSSYTMFINQSLTLSFAPNVGLVGRVWCSQKPEWIEDISQDKSQGFWGVKLAPEVGLKTAFAFPIVFNNQVLAVLVLYKKTASSVNLRLIELVTSVATQLGSLIKQKQTEEMLRIAETRYHNIVENAVDGIYQTTPDGQYLSANLALAKMYGYDSTEDLIANLKDISQQLYVDPKRWSELISQIECQNTVVGFESQVYRKDRKKIWIAENTRAVRDAKGNLLYCEGTVSDITERKIAQEQTEKLLLNIFPQPVAQRLQDKHSVIADSFSEVSVLLADLVGFTDFASRKSPDEVVEILNLIFSNFDLLSKQHGLEKIKTIGDAYMVVGGLPNYRPDHATSIVEMAIDMQAVLASFNTHINENFSLRIGINMGPAVAGVIGVYKFIYDLWGDTVNVASRMESCGIPGEIQVTAAVYERLKDEFIFKQRGSIPIKGKGEMTTYLIVGRKQ